MSQRDADKVADAVLLEGYLLYPYRASALKNQHRYPFGTLYPESFCRAHEAGDASSLELQCVVRGGAAATLSLRLRFLQIHPSPAAPETREARLVGCPLGARAQTASTAFEFGPIRGAVSIEGVQLRPDVGKVTIRVANQSDLEHPERHGRDGALGYALASPHLIVTVTDGAFASMIDPPEDIRDIAASCRSRGTWPVLLGDPGATDTLLSAPIILEDYPRIAPQSPGDFFDGTEVDELLTLRVLTLTDAEKREMSASDDRARSLLERTEALGLEALRTLHGAVRTLTPGARVLLRPNGRADIMDLALASKRATVRAVERDYEGRTYIVVTIDEDPGQDLGAFGHRFFFRPDEVETL
jgi:hypothetical protein